MGQWSGPSSKIILPRNLNVQVCTEMSCLQNHHFTGVEVVGEGSSAKKYFLGIAWNVQICTAHMFATSSHEVGWGWGLTSKRILFQWELNETFKFAQTSCCQPYDFFQKLTGAQNTPRGGDWQTWLFCVDQDISCNSRKKFPTEPHPTQ